MSETKSGQALAQELKKQLESHGGTRHALAEKAHVAQSYMKQIFEGQLPSYNMVVKIATKGFDIDPDILLDAAGYLPKSRGIKYIQGVPEIDGVPLNAEELEVARAAIRGLRNYKKSTKQRAPSKRQGGLG